jgi:hypothetical protein
MDERPLSNREADAINDRMAAEIEQRRLQRPDRRQRLGRAAVERRRICSYCFQRGDHPTVVHCLRALERNDRAADAVD